MTDKMAFDDYSKSWVNSFIDEFDCSREKWNELKKLWDRKCCQEFVSWFNKVMALSLRNLSVKNADLTVREGGTTENRYPFGNGHILVATKNGIRQRRSYGRNSDDLNFEGICYMLNNKALVKAWFVSNNPIKEAVFDELCSALEFVTTSFQLIDLKPDTRSYYDFQPQPQHSMVEFKHSVDISTYTLREAKVVEAKLKNFRFGRHSDYFDIICEFEFADGRTALESFSGSANPWTWLPQREIFPELNAFLGICIDKVKVVQSDFDVWVSNVKQKLLSYASLVAL